MHHNASLKNKKSLRLEASLVSQNRRMRYHFLLKRNASELSSFSYLCVFTPNMNHSDVMIDIKGMLERAEPPLTGECCIYNVPFHIRSLNHDAYTPKVVSVGPFHHGNPRLLNMQRHKLIYCNKFLERAKSFIDLDTLVCHIEQLEPSVRRCYCCTLDLTPEELVKVVLVDSCFIFELFWLYFHRHWPEDDTLLSKPWLVTSIGLDLLLLENQLPFFVLDTLFNQTLGSGAGRVPSFLELTFDFFDHHNSSKLAYDSGLLISHFTDLLRAFHLKPLETVPFKKGRTNESMIHLQSATELLEAGVTFKVNKKSKCLLDLRFSGKVLEIPQLRVHDWTEGLFRNLIALEQCHYPGSCYFTDYVAVLDYLINTDRDVKVLFGKGILVNWLGDGDAVAKLFNGLGKNITYVNFSDHYFILCKGLDSYCRSHKWSATFWRDYGKTPYQFVASIAGIVLLILTLLQSVCSVISVLQQAR